jgi:peptidoglycan hydrolase-like protein with peptidoglycan-binding domain
MRSVLSATLMVLAMGASAQAQLTPPTTAGAKPKVVTTVPIRPALQKPEETANAMAQIERLALQSDLAWVGEYNGAITGDVSERMVAAIKEFQKARGGKQTGVLNPQERGVLADTARRRQDSVGWKIVTDPGTGVRLGIPTKLAPQQSSDANGAKWRLRPPERSRFSWRGARKPTPPPQNWPSGKRGSRGATSTTPWSSRTSSCCPACKA